MNEYGLTSFQSKVTGFWELDVGIPYVPAYDFDVDDSNVNAIVGHLSHSSGAGFGYRDLQYAVSTPWKAKRLANQIREELGFLDEPEKGQGYVGCYYVAPYLIWKLWTWLDRKGIRTPL